MLPLLTVIAEYGKDAYSCGNYSQACNNSGGFAGLLPNTGGGWFLFIASLISVVTAVVSYILMLRHKKRLATEKASK